jgi:phage shock protein PspC (stress-responsive transcriptional regulator)
MRRSSDNRVLAGICAGISQTTGIDVTLLRIGVVIVGLASGFPVLIYALAWLIVPLNTETTNIFSRAVADRRGIRLVIAVIPLVVITQIVVSLLHVSFVGIISWPVFLAAGLTILIWRNASEPPATGLAVRGSGAGLHRRRGHAAGGGGGAPPKARRGRSRDHRPGRDGGGLPPHRRLTALLDAAREATVNSAKWSGAPQVSLYAEVEPGAVMLFVRDRGQGFDPAAVPADRQGIAQSIRARMARYGGTVVIRSAPGEGTEVELKMPVPTSTSTSTSPSPR